MNEQRPHIGSSFDDFLAEEGILEECRAVALEEIRRMLDDGEEPTE